MKNNLDHPIVDEIRRLAAERPDHIDPYANSGSCSYFVGGQPSCIVGHAIHRVFGLTDAVEGEGARFILLDIDPEIPLEVCDWAELVQEKQDSGETWEESVEYADAYL